MRLNSKNVQPEISVLHESERPIRLNVGTQLADAVEEFRNTHERKATP